MTLAFAAACAVLLQAADGAVSDGTACWPQFRGPGASGLAAGDPPPATWSVPEGRNVAWRTGLPGLAHSSPVVWGDHVFVTCAEGEDEAALKVGLYGAGEPLPDEGPHRFSVLCLDRGDGSIVWEELAHEGVPEVKRHPKSSHANSTPAVDAEHVVAFFGSEGLYCFDHDGILLWSRDFGVLDCGAPGMPDLQWGFASSPVLCDGKVLVQCDVQAGSFVALLDADTGEEVWRTARDEGPTWGTPAVVGAGDGRQVVCNGYRRMAGYDFATGEELWWLQGGGDVPVPTPVAAHGLVYVTNAHGRLAPVFALDPAARGALQLAEDEPALRWFHPRRGIYMQTPLVVGDELYLCNDAGVLACLDARTGEERYRERLGDGRTGFSASGVAAGDRLYFTGEEGRVHVVRAGPAFAPLAVNELGEVCMATPAVAEGRLYFRTRSHLVAIGEAGG